MGIELPEPRTVDLDGPVRYREWDGPRDTTFVLFDSAARNRRGLAWTVTATLGDGSTVSSLPIRLVPPAR